RSSILLCAAEDSVPIVARQGSRHFFEQLELQWLQNHQSQPESLPFEGGWFVYLGYEAVAEIELKLHLPEADDCLPVAFAQRCDAALVVEHGSGMCWLVAENQNRLDSLRTELSEELPTPIESSLPELNMRTEAPERFIDGVERIRQYIVEGDVFQVNLSRRWQAEACDALDPVDLYRRLSRANAAPFAGLARLPGGVVLSSSPERLVESRHGIAQTRPIAGTRPRGGSAAHDRALSDELLAHPKERAEHVMLIDLERNDLGRVCKPGSVEVDELMQIESYAHVHHIVSNIRGELREDANPIDLIRAVFPGGTITGCPKVRCMEIIAELESAGRSFYTGSMGYLGLDGRLDLNILIRSMSVSGHKLEFRTGAGIVADSIAKAEVAETEAKAAGLLHALHDD
ncbi:MAG: aminodeoxychorismate synthase component I, partial [Pseudomonadota bacterium]